MTVSKIIKTILMLLPIAVLINHTVRTSHSNLSKWKGGGMAMYTDSHINNRALYLITNDTDRKKIFPLFDKEIEQLDATQKELYFRDRNKLLKLITYPEYYKNELSTLDYLTELKETKKSYEVRSIFYHALDNSITNELIYGYD